MPNTEPVVGEALSFDLIEEEEYEEWVSVDDARFFVEWELQLALTSPQVEKIAKKFNLLSGREGHRKVRREQFLEVCRKIYFPDIPKGYKTMRFLSKKYGYNWETIKLHVIKGTIKAQLIKVGLQEVWFVEEKDFKQFFERNRFRRRYGKKLLTRRPIGKKQVHSKKR